MNQDLCVQNTTQQQILKITGLLFVSLQFF